MPNPIDYADKKIGRVFVTSLNYRGEGKSKWNCRCDCGNKFISNACQFKKGEKFECKKCVFERKRGIDLTGRKYGRWTVLKRCLDSRNKTVWHCKCDCGNEGYIAKCALGNPKKSMSCGCLGRKLKSKWANPSLYPKASGLSKTRFYHMRTQLIHKCYRENFPTYQLFGGKGITVCDLWRNSARDMYEWAIENGWEEGVCIVLKSGCKEYSPETSYLIHNDDYRAIISQNVGKKINYKGENLSLSDWGKKLDIDLTTLRKRLKIYPSIDEAFETPRKKMTFFNNSHLKNQAIEMFKKCRSYKKVAAHFGVTSSAIHYHIKNSGISREWNRLEIDDEEIKSLIESGSSINSIAKKFSTSWICISNRLKRMKKRKCVSKS